MKYVNKNGAISLAGKAILDSWKITNHTVIATLSVQGKTKQLWNRFDKKKEIREHLHEEQGGLCCYCGCELTKMTHYLVIEHFKLKKLEPHNQYPNMFDYDNLLLSCHGNKFTFYVVEEDDTWASIASKPECTFSVDKLSELKRMNPDVEKLVNGEPNEGEILIVGSKIGATNHHCDNYRGDKPLLINPTQLPNCIDRFIYTVQERNNQGGVKHHSGDIEAEEAIRNLNLNAAVLIRFRQRIVEDAAELLESISIELEENETTDREGIIEIANKYLSGIKGFYVVYRAYFKNDFPELFAD
jgi:uncharacterized protein (TIGR02646 family)